MRTGSVGFVFSSAPIKPTAKVTPAKVLPIAEPMALKEVSEEPEIVSPEIVSPVLQSPIKEPEVHIPSTVPEALYPLAKVDMNFLKGITMEVKPEALVQQINNMTIFKEGVDILFHNLKFILSFSPFVNIKTNFRDNIKFITTTQNTDYTYVLSPLKLIDHILLSNRIATHLQNEGKTQFNETEVVQLCTTLWAPVNVLAGDCLSTIHNITAFYTREALNMKSLNLENLLNAATSLNNRTVTEMSTSLTFIMNTYASLLNYEKLLQQNYAEFINVLNEGPLEQKTSLKTVEIVPEKKPSFLRTLISDKIVPYAKITGESLVSDLTERILDLEDMNNVSGSTIWAWTTELLATEANNLVSKSDSLITEKATSFLITYIDAAGLDKFTNNFAKQAVRKTIPVVHQKIKTKLTNIVTRARTKAKPPSPASVVDINAIANLMTLKCAELDLEKCIVEPFFTDNILADGIMSTCLTVKLNDAENHPIPGKSIEMKSDNSLTVVILPKVGSSDKDGSTVFSLSNTVTEIVNISVFYDNKIIGRASVKFIPVVVFTPTVQPADTTPVGISGSYFNNILNIQTKSNTQLSINYSYKINSTKSCVITESKITDSEGYVTFYSFPEKSQFNIGFNGNTYSGNTNSAIIDFKRVVEPIETVEPVKPVEPIETVQPVEPVETIETVEPVETIETVEPVEPIETVQPVEPVETVQPVEPVETIETVQPVEPVEPIETVDPVEPVETIETVDPVEPVETIETEE